MWKKQTSVSPGKMTTPIAPQKEGFKKTERTHSGPFFITAVLATPGLKRGDQVAKQALL